MMNNSTIFDVSDILTYNEFIKLYVNLCDVYNCCDILDKLLSINSNCIDMKITHSAIPKSWKEHTHLFETTDPMFVSKNQMFNVIWKKYELHSVSDIFKPASLFSLALRGQERKSQQISPNYTNIKCLIKYGVDMTIIHNTSKSSSSIRPHHT